MKLKQADKMKLKQTAIHEAGHVVVGHALGLAVKAVALTHHEVDKTGIYGLATGPNPMYGYDYSTERDRQEGMKAEAVTCCAGLAAEHVFFGVPLDTDNENASGDIENIFDLLSAG